MKQLSELLKTKKILMLGLIVVLIGTILIFLIKSRNSTGEEVVMQSQSYTSEEYAVANTVTDYLRKYLILEDKTENDIVDFAVKKYTTILNSDVSQISEEHSKALRNAIKDDLYINLANLELTDENLEALSSGICAIIMEEILVVLESSDISENSQYKDEYKIMVSSLQEQIYELQNQSSKIKIIANVKDKVPDDSNSISSSEYAALQEKLKNEILSEINSEYGDIISQLDKDMTELEKQTNKKSTNSGKDGKDGKNGAAGAVGKQGESGKTTFIAYAEDATGKGFSLTPTESTRCIGTCITTEATQPTKPASYTWQVYRTYIITSATDENDVTTLYIN